MTFQKFVCVCVFVCGAAVSQHMQIKNATPSTRRYSWRWGNTFCSYFCSSIYLSIYLYLYYTLNPVPFLSTCHTCIHFFPAQIWLPLFAFFPPRWTPLPVTWLRPSRCFILFFCCLLLCPVFLCLKTAPPLLSSEPKTPSFFFLLQLFFVRSETPPVFCFCGFCNRCCVVVIRLLLVVLLLFPLPFQLIFLFHSSSSYYYYFNFFGNILYLSLRLRYVNIFGNMWEFLSFNN